MQVAPEVIFKDIDRTLWVESYVAERLGHLEKFSPDITRCHVTVARPSSVWRFPATPRRTVCVPTETGGSGAATTIPVAKVVAEAEPPALVAVTTSERVEPMSSGVRV